MLDQQFWMSGITGITDNGAKSCHSLPDTCRMLHILYLVHIAVILHLGEHTRIHSDHILFDHIPGKSKR